MDLHQVWQGLRTETSISWLAAVVVANMINKQIVEVSIQDGNQTTFSGPKSRIVISVSVEFLLG